MIIYPPLSLKWVDFSYNKIQNPGIWLPIKIQKFFLQNNNLKYYNLNQTVLETEFIDISNNQVMTFSFTPNPNQAANTTISLKSNDMFVFLIDTNLLRPDHNFTFLMEDFGLDRHCGCLLERIFTYQRNFYQLHFDFGGTTCSSPEYLKNRPIEDVSKDVMCKDGCMDFDGCKCFTREFDKSVLLNCTRIDINNFTILAKPNVPLDSSYHQLRIVLSSHLWTELPTIPDNLELQVTEVQAQNNLIEYVTLANIRDSLKILDLRNNKISVLNIKVAAKFKTMNTTSLGGNPWICDCFMFNLFQFLHVKNILIDFDDVKCENFNKTLSDVDVSEVCFNWNFVIIPCAVIFGMFSLLIALFYKFTKDIKIFLYHHNMCLWFANEDDLDADKKYDAFFCFAALDQHLIEDIVERLEDGPKGFKLLVGERNWMAGQMIPELVSLG